MCSDSLRTASHYKLDPVSRGFFGNTGPLAVDLFAGAGGISLGLVNAGFDVIFASDISEACARTYSRNFPGTDFHRGDIRELRGNALLHRFGLDRGQLDLLIGGPPCQGFSILGQRKIGDPRNDLFREFIRLTGELRPKIAVIENVPGLATLHGGVLLHEIGREFQDLDYRVECAELLSAQYGVPQMRWRMFFVAVRFDLGTVPISFPLPTHGRAGIGELVPNRTVSADDSAGFLTIRDAFSDLPAITSGGVLTRYDRVPESAFQYAMRKHSGSALYNHYAPRLSDINLRRIGHLRPGEDWRSLPRELLPDGMKRALRKDHTRRFRRMTWDGVARAIITRFRDPKSGEYIHPEQTRTISIREAARIQSFPDWFAFEGAYTDQYDQVGNAVPPLLAKAVGLEIKRALDPRLLKATVGRLFGAGDLETTLVVPAIRLANTDMQLRVNERLVGGHRVFIYFDEKLGGELSIPGTARSPEFSFDVTIIEIELVAGAPHVGRFAVLEIQTMDFHGSYGHVVRNLKDTLRMFPTSFGSTLKANQRLLSERIEGPNIANVFKRTFYQMMFKFQLGKSDQCAGCALAIQQSVWDSWKPHLADAVLQPCDDGTFSLFKPGQPRPAHVPAWVYIFDLKTDTGEAPDPIEIRAVIATDAASFSYYALEAAPDAALTNIVAPNGMLALLARRLSRLWPELAATILVDGITGIRRRGRKSRQLT